MAADYRNGSVASADPSLDKSPSSGLLRPLHEAGIPPSRSRDHRIGVAVLRIAILGGGGVGVCAALELARHGHHADIFEQEALPIRRASRVNEGKIHQGVLYAKDPTNRTAELMMRGALAFSAALSRWIDVDDAALGLSTPFIYAVHEDSLVGADVMRAHFARCYKLFEEMRAASGLTYLGTDSPGGFHDLSPRDSEAILDPRAFSAAIMTSELSVDPRRIADRLSAAVLAEPRVTFIGISTVTEVKRRGAGPGFDIVFDRGGDRQKAGPYDQVINASWENRLVFDKQLGIAPPQPWIHRHKFGNRVRIPLRADDLPSLTVVLGAFGDIVNYRDGGFYLSWYPIGMVAKSHDLAPPPGWREISDDQRRDVFDRSLAHWRALCPPLDRLKFPSDAVDATSGAIFAWGETDVDDPNSKLHDRYQIGVHSAGGYHSVNTGKYTMVPYLGLQAANRVMGIEDDGLRLPAA
jgi:hypothetical protein